LVKAKSLWLILQYLRAIGINSRNLHQLTPEGKIPNLFGKISAFNHSTGENQ